MPYRKIPPKKNPGRDEVRRLARQHTVEAMEKLVGLMESNSEYVRMTAARTVLLQSEMATLRSLRMGRSKPPRPSGVNVTIKQMQGGEKRGTDKRDRKLPVVQGRRKRSRDARDADDTGMHKMRGERPDIRDEP